MNIKLINSHQGPTGERHTVNLNNSPGLSRPAETYLMNPLVETTTSKKVKTTRKNTITTKTTTKKPKPTKKTTKSAKKPKPVVVKPNPKPSPGIKKPLTAKPKEVAPTVDKTCRKCQCRKSPESPNCSPSPCRSIPTSKNIYSLSFLVYGVFFRAKYLFRKFLYICQESCILFIVEPNS